MITTNIMPPATESPTLSIHRPPDYDSKPRIALGPTWRADVACKVLYRALLKVLRLNEDGARRDLDAEFLHDFRVAVRRTRSALSQVPGVFSPAATGRFKKDFAWLGRISGPTRDLDVFLLQLPGHSAHLDGAQGHALEPLVELLKRHQVGEQKILAQALASQRYTDLVQTWGEFLDHPVPEGEVAAAPNARQPVLEVASAQIWKTYRRLAQRGRKIDPRTAPEAVHRLRIQGKKLRYLLELFYSLYPEAGMRSLIRELKQLQEVLGEFNDLEVQQHHLRGCSSQLAASHPAGSATAEVVARLLKYLAERQRQERERFHQRFTAFDQVANRERFQELFGGGTRPV